MPNNTRRNNNRKREAELFEKALGVAGETGYKNASRVAKRLSKRSANNHLTRWRRKTNATKVAEARRTARERLANLDRQRHEIEEQLQELQIALENIELAYNPTMNPPQVTSGQRRRMRVLREQISELGARLMPLSMQRDYLETLITSPNNILAEPAITPLEQMRLNEEEARARRAAEQEALVVAAAAAAGPPPLKFENLARQMAEGKSINNILKVNLRSRGPTGPAAAGAPQ